MSVTNTQELFLHELSDVYDAEHRFLEGQQEMLQEATAPDLRSAIENHIEQTRQQIQNLERVFTQLGQKPRRETCEAAQGLVSEAREGIQETPTSTLRDCAIVSAIIKVEHYEMGSYRGMVTGAQLMGQTEIERLLSENMHQEEETARIAESSAEELLGKAMQAEGEQPEEKGLVDKAKDKLTG
jgi:ferritin-like metal-binding protein YciE